MKNIYGALLWHCSVIIFLRTVFIFFTNKIFLYLHKACLLELWYIFRRELFHGMCISVFQYPSALYWLRKRPLHSIDHSIASANFISNLSLWIIVWLKNVLLINTFLFTKLIERVIKITNVILIRQLFSKRCWRYLRNRNAKHFKWCSSWTERELLHLPEFLAHNEAKIYNFSIHILWNLHLNLRHFVLN